MGSPGQRLERLLPLGPASQTPRGPPSDLWGAPPESLGGFFLHYVAPWGSLGHSDPRGPAPLWQRWLGSPLLMETPLLMGSMGGGPRMHPQALWRHYRANLDPPFDGIRVFIGRRLQTLIPNPDELGPPGGRRWHAERAPRSVSVGPKGGPPCFAPGPMLLGHRGARKGPANTMRLPVKTGVFSTPCTVFTDRALPTRALATPKVQKVPVRAPQTLQNCKSTCTCVWGGGLGLAR